MFGLGRGLRVALTKGFLYMVCACPSVAWGLRHWVLLHKACHQAL